MTNLDDCIAQITKWGRANVNRRTGVASDTSGYFSPSFTEYVRRELRSIAIDDTTGKVTGSWRNGYRLHIGNNVTGEVVGVGRNQAKNGFVVFYMPARDNYLIAPPGVWRGH